MLNTLSEAFKIIVPAMSPNKTSNNGCQLVSVYVHIWLLNISMYDCCVVVLIYNLIQKFVDI